MPFAVAHPSTALAACNPGRTTTSGIWFDGTFKVSVGPARNIRANIEEYSPFIAGDAPTSAWVMLTHGTFPQWAQVGWWKEATGARATFMQWTHVSGVGGTEHMAASPVGTSPKYQMVYNPASGGTASEWVFEKNGSILWRISPAEWAPDGVQVNGETHTEHNQMPGGFNAPLYLDQVQYTIGGAWLDINSPAVATDPDIHGKQFVNSHFYKIWDKACAT